MAKLYEEILPVEVMETTNVVTTGNANTGRISFSGFRKIMFYFLIDAANRDAWVDDQTLSLNLMQATAITGGTTSAIESGIELVGGSNMLEGEIWVEGHADGDSVVVNGITFARTTAGYAADRPLEWNTPAQLRDGINANCDGITADAVAATHGVPLSVDDPGSMTLNVDVSIVAATGQLATLKAAAVVEVSDAEAAQDYIYVNVDNDHATAVLAGTVGVRGFAIKGNPYHAPVRQTVVATR